MAYTLRVASAVIPHNGKVYMVKRADCGLWEFPGGQIEALETTTNAAVREVKEELSILVLAQQVLGSVTVNHIKRKDLKVNVTFVLCEAPSRQTVVLEKDAFLEGKWVNRLEFERLATALEMTSGTIAGFDLIRHLLR